MYLYFFILVCCLVPEEKEVRSVFSNTVLRYKRFLKKKKKTKLYLCSILIEVGMFDRFVLLYGDNINTEL